MALYNTLSRVICLFRDFQSGGLDLKCLDLARYFEKRPKRRSRNHQAAGGCENIVEMSTKRLVQNDGEKMFKKIALVIVLLSVATIVTMFIIDGYSSETNGVIPPLVYIVALGLLLIFGFIFLFMLVSPKRQPIPPPPKRYSIGE